MLELGVRREDVKRKFVGEAIHVANNGVTFHTTVYALVGGCGAEDGMWSVIVLIAMVLVGYLLVLHREPRPS